MVDVFFRGYGAWLIWEDEEANYPISDRYLANGVFSLTEEDEVKYRHTESLKGIDTLCPSNHSDSEFKQALGRGMFDTELARLAEAAKFHLGSELVDPEQFHSTLEKTARFHFNADKEMSLVLAKQDNIKTPATAAKTKCKNNITVPKNNNGKKPVAREIGETINKENPSLTVEKIAKKIPLEMTSRKSEKGMSIRSDLIPKEGFLKIWQILGDPKATPPIPALIPISRTTFLSRVKDGTYPQSVKLGKRSVGWRVQDIRDLIEKIGANK